MWPLVLITMVILSLNMYHLFPVTIPTVQWILHVQYWRCFYLLISFLFIVQNQESEESLLPLECTWRVLCWAPPPIGTASQMFNLTTMWWCVYSEGGESPFSLERTLRILHWLSSKPHLSKAQPHKLSIWPPCGTVLTGAVVESMVKEGNRFFPLSVPREFCTQL